MKGFRLEFAILNMLHVGEGVTLKGILRFSILMFLWFLHLFLLNELDLFEYMCYHFPSL